jgi:hypothetical protein
MEVFYIMDQRDADAAALVGQVDVSNTGPDPGSGPLTGSISPEQEFELQELLDYLPVPFRQDETRLVRFRRGNRLQPLPYTLDDENP